MALNWRWDSKIGELTVKQTINEETKEYVKTIYEGNAFLIFLNEWQDEKCGENMYSMYSFFADETHAKRCLGLVKNYSNIFNDHNTKVVKIRLNKTKSHNWKKVVSLFAQAFDDITIELYTERENNDDNNNA